MNENVKNSKTKGILCVLCCVFGSNLTEIRRKNYTEQQSGQITTINCV